ncbi:MAG: hypothetical protein WCW84_00700 [Sulfurimonas sp.]|jgi:hypothetical protein
MIRAVGLAFSAMNVESHVQTKQQLESEVNIGQVSDVSKVSSIQKMAVAPNSNEKTVVFADPVNGNLVKLNLSNENIDKLKKHFGEGDDNFHERKDGTLRLNGNAEAYVSGWFGDVAYKREFLKADADGNGKLSNEEYQNTKNGFLGSGLDHLSVSNGEINVIDSTERIDKSYVKPTEETHKKGTVRYNDDYHADSIESELNTTIRIDSNMDSYVTLNEAYRASAKNQGLATDNIITKHIEEYYGKGTIANRENPFKDRTLDELKMLFEKTDNKEAQKILEKLRVSNGNESVLSADEKAVLGAEISKLQERKSDFSSVKEGIKTSVETTRFIDVKG